MAFLFTGNKKKQRKRATYLFRKFQCIDGPWNETGGVGDHECDEDEAGGVLTAHALVALRDVAGLNSGHPQQRHLGRHAGHRQRHEWRVVVEEEGLTPHLALHRGQAEELQAVPYGPGWNTPGHWRPYDAHGQRQESEVKAHHGAL